MSLKEKLKSVHLESNFERLSEEKLSKVFGGGSCNVTASSSSCDRTAVCNCPNPELDIPKEDCLYPSTNPITLLP